MTDETKTLTDLDEQAAELCYLFQENGVAAFVIRCSDDGSVRMIGLDLPRDAVLAILRSVTEGCADALPPNKARN